MTLGKEMHPAFALRSYAWAVLNKNMPEVWTTSKYGGKNPIIPLAEVREIEQYSEPYIVYGFADNPTSTNNAERYGSMTFAVYDDNFRNLTSTMQTLMAAFERHDEAARDVNVYTSKPELYKAFGGLRFGYIGIGFTEGGTPETEEGGNQSALLNIRYSYTLDYDGVVTTTV